jgi:predicted small secreted protein
MRIIAYILAMFLGFTLTACGTVRGIGEDLQTSSETVRGWF